MRWGWVAVAMWMAGCGGGDGSVHSGDLSGKKLPPSWVDWPDAEAVVLMVLQADGSAGASYPFIRRFSLSPGEQAELHLRTQTGDEITDGVTFTSSVPEVARVEGATVIGVSDGETVLCGKSGKRQACHALVVNLYVTSIFGSDRWGSQTHNIPRSLDGHPSSLPTGMEFAQTTTLADDLIATPDGRYIFNLKNRWYFDSLAAKSFEAPAPTGDGMGLEYVAAFSLEQGLYLLAMNFSTFSLWGGYAPDIATAGLARLPLPDGVVPSGFAPLLRVDVSRDGRWAAVLGGPNLPEATQQMHLLDLQAGISTVLFDLPAGTGYLVGPALGPDGKTLSFASYGTGGIFGTLVFDISQPVPVLDVHVPPGDKLIYAPWTDGCVAANIGFFDPGISYSPDGRWLLVHTTTNSGDTSAGVTLVDVTSGDVVPLPGPARFGVGSTVLFSQAGTTWMYEPETGQFGPTELAVGTPPLHPSGLWAPDMAIDLPIGACPACFGPKDAPTQRFQGWLTKGTAIRLTEAVAEEDPGTFLAYPYGTTWGEAGPLMSLGDVPQTMPATIVGLAITGPDGRGGNMVEAGNRNIVDYEVADNGQIFMITDAGHLVVSTPSGASQRVLTMLARPPLNVSPDGGRVAFLTPETKTRVLDVLAGVTLVEIDPLHRLCLPAAEAPGYGIDQFGRLVRVDTVAGTTEVVGDYGGLLPEQATPQRNFIACDQEARHIAVLTELDGVGVIDTETAELTDAETDDQLVAAGVAMSGDGKWVGAFGIRERSSHSVVEVVMGTGPGWKLKPVVSYAAHGDDTEYEIRAMGLSRGGQRAAILWKSLRINQGWNPERGPWLSMFEDAYILLYDGADGSVTNIMRATSDGTPMFR